MFKKSGKEEGSREGFVEAKGNDVHQTEHCG
jgi:hypothetical protein